MARRIFAAIFFLMIGAPVFGAVDPTVFALQEDINGAIAKVRPSVVSVRVRKQMRPPEGQGNDLRWYESIGSGFVVDSKGYILTNYHVVKDGVDVSVRLWRSGENTFVATLVEADPSGDLALLKVSAAETFVPAELGDSALIEVGDYVICIGSPFGFNHSASLGIVSDLHRQIGVGRVAYKDMIQTDAVINEGNSGGPMIDLRGKVVGMSTAIYAPEGTFRGLGFAIPINRTKDFYAGILGRASQPLFRLAAAQAGGKEAISMNSPMPGDAVHRNFSDCRTCHTITQKMPASYKAPIPHETIGLCSQCHIMTNDPVARGPLAVAANVPSLQKPVEVMSYPELLKKIVIKIIPMVLVSSLVFSMIGVGGGFMYVPVLLASGIDFDTASTTSLIMLTCAQSTAVFNYFRSGLVDLKTALIMEPPTMVGAFMGGLWAHYLNVHVLTVAFGCVLFAASYMMMQNSVVAKGNAGGAAVAWSPFQWRHRFRGHDISIDVGLAVPICLCVGYIGGMLGVGGGWLKVPVMVLLFSVPMKIAVATSTLMVLLTGMAGFFGHSFAGHWEPRLALTLSVVAMTGAFIGSKVSIGAEARQLRFIFAFILSIIGLWMLASVFLGG